MLVKFYKYNLKRKKFYYSLIIYYICIKYNILYFIYIDYIKYNLYYLNDVNIKNIRINNTYILSLFSNKYHNKFLSNIFRKKLLIIFSNNFLFLENIINKFLFNNIIMISLNYFFINVKYLNKINIIYNLL